MALNDVENESAVILFADKVCILSTELNGRSAYSLISHSYLDSNRVFCKIFAQINVYINKENPSSVFLVPDLIYRVFLATHILILLLQFNTFIHA